MTISHRRRTKIVWAAKAWVGYARGPDGGRSARGAEFMARKVVFIGTGGTIASIGKGPLDLIDYGAP
jgi:hypothetical protein